MDIAEARDIALRTDLEAIVTLRDGLGLTTATPLQRAICRVATGVPLAELADHPHVLEAVGRTDLLWPGQPDELVWLGPSRTGKSTIVAGLAIRASQTVDLSLAKTDGEPPLYPVISLDKKKAGAVWTVVKDAFQGPFAHLLAKEPSGGVVRVRHPSGAEVEIAVVAGKADGAAVISRWLIGLALDEAARMQGSERQINLPETLAAARDRMLPGAQIAMISSKWAPYGPVYDLAQEHGGRPNREKSIIVIGAAGCEAEKLNPAYYTTRRLEKLKAKDRSAWLVARNKWQAPPENLFDLSYLQQLARPAVRCDCDVRQRAGFASPRGPACPHNDSPPHPRQHYVAVIDPATRGNAWALVLLTVREILERRLISDPSPSDYLKDVPDDPRPRSTPLMGPLRHHVRGYRDDAALCRQWQGTPQAPLDSDATFAEIAELLRPYRCNRVYTDPWSADSLRVIARQYGLYLIEAKGCEGKAMRMRDKVESFDAIKTALSMHEQGHHDRRSLELHPCPALLGDLSRVVRRTTLSGVVVELPLSGDGRHCDYAAALALGYTQVLQRPDREAEALPSTWTQDEIDEADKLAERLGLTGVPDECRYDEPEGDDDYGW